MDGPQLDILHTLASERRRPILVQEIAEAVAVAFGVTVDDVFGRSKAKSISEARGVTCYVARCCTRMSFPELGRALGLDQSTVRSAVLSVQARRSRDRWTDSACAVLLEQFVEIGEARTQ